MNDGDRLWNAILDRPFSRSLRQIYADWLEEHGDPRGEFIRLQDRAVPRDPWHEGELLRAHEAEWLGSLAEHATDWDFRHGLLHQATVDAERFLAHGHEWVRRPGLLGLRLTNVQDHVHALADCPHLRRIPFLWLGYCELSASDMERLTSSPHLQGVQALSFKEAEPFSQPLDFLFRAPSLAELRVLSLPPMSFHSGWQVPVDCTWHRLRSLDLESVEDPNALLSLASAAYAKTLRRLWITGALDSFLEPFAQLPLLRRLCSLRLEVISPCEALRTLFSSPNLGSLQCLTIATWEASTTDLGVLLRNRSLRKLRSLTLGGLDRAEDYAAFGEPGILPGLRSVTLWPAYRQGQTTPPEVGPGQRALLSGTLVRQLRQLHLGSDRLSSEALAALAGPGTLPLRDLQIRVGEGNAAVLSDLVASGRLASLRRLRLTGVFQDGFGAALAPPGCLPHLRSLCVESIFNSDAEALSATIFPKLERLRFTLVHDVGPPPAEALERWLAGLRLRVLLLGDHPKVLRPFRHIDDFPHLEDLAAFDTTDELEEQLADWPGLGRLRTLHLQGGSPRTSGLRLARSPYWSKVARLRGSFGSQAEPLLKARLGPRASITTISDTLPA